MSFVMHNKGITHIVKKLNWLQGPKLMFFLLPFERAYVKKKFLGNHNAKARFETFKDYNSLITSLSIGYIGEFMTLNQKDPMLFIWIFFINLLPN